MTKSTSPLTKYLNALNYTNENLVSHDTTDFSPYVINHCLMHSDTIFLANEMNRRPHLSVVLVNKFYLHAIKKRKRFSPWLKPEKISNLELVQKAYNINRAKAKSALLILTETQLNILRDKYTEKNV